MNMLQSRKINTEIKAKLTEMWTEVIDKNMWHKIKLKSLYSLNLFSFQHQDAINVSPITQWDEGMDNFYH